MRDKRFWNILLAAFFSSFGSSMYFIAVAWILYQMTSNASYSGFMVGLGFLPGVFLNIVFGIFVDRWNRKRLTVAAQGIVTLSMLLLLIAMALQTLLPWMILTVHVLVQTFSSLYRTAQQAFITEIYEKKDIPRVYSESGAATSVGGLLGASAGGMALAMFSSPVVMGIVCLSFVIAMVCTVLVPHHKVHDGKPARQISSVLQDFTESFRYLNRNRLMYRMFSLMFVGQLVIHTSAGMLSVYTSSHLIGTSFLYGLLESAASIGAVIAGITDTRYLNRTKRYIATGSLFVTGGGLLLLAISRHGVAAFLAIFLVGLGTTWLRVLMQSVQQIATEPAYYGRMAAYRQMVNQSSVAIGGPILGVIAENYGANVSYAALLIPVGLSLLLSIGFSRDARFTAIIDSILSKQNKQAGT